MALYRLSALHEAAAGAVGVHDLATRQHVQQLMHALLAGCRQASLPFAWLRAQGLRSVSAALAQGLGDGAALSSVLDTTYSSILEAVLSALDHDLIPPMPPAAAELAAAAAAEPPRKARLSEQQAAQLLAAVGRCAAGHAPTAASAEELREAFRVLQALALLHPKSRALLASAQYLQLLTARACECPGDCLEPALHTLLAVLQDNEEAQAVFVTTGSLELLLSRALVPGASSWHGSSGAGPDLSLQEQLLVFLQLLIWAVGQGVRRGAHPSTQRSAQALMARHLGPRAAVLLAAAASELGSDGSLKQRAREAADLAASFQQQQQQQQQHRQRHGGQGAS